MKTSLYRIYNFLAALIISFGFGAACLNIPVLSKAISDHGNINLLTYAMTVVLFCLVYFLLSLLSVKKQMYGIFSFPAGAFLVCMVILAAHLVFLVVMFCRETEVYGSYSYKYIWHNMPMALVFLCIAIIFFCFLCFIRRSTISMHSQAPVLLYGMLSVLAAYNFYTPEIFLRDVSDRHHTHAYFNSIYNVMHGQAYTETTTSIYGHYALFYKLPMKILGNDNVDFILLNACVGGLCFFAAFLALHFMIKNNLLRITGSIAISFPILAMRSGIYWQLWPHRILFMSLMLCCMAFCISKRKLNLVTCILGYVLAAAAILWNTESGLFCAAAWSGFWILRTLCDSGKSLIKSTCSILLNILGIIISFLSAYGIVELYNIHIQGHGEGIKEFLFPLLQSSYMDDTLRVDLPQYPTAYMVILALFFLATAWGISHMRFFKRPEAINSDQVLVPSLSFAIAVLGLGQLTYFINRAAYHNLEICHIPAILLLCLLAEKGIPFIRQFHLKDLKLYPPASVFHGAFTGVALLVLITLCTGTAVQYGYNTSMRAQFHNQQEAMDFAANVAANISENTYGFGNEIAEIYSMLRWDTQCYTLDFSDLPLRPQVADYVIDDIRQKNVPGFLSGEGAIAMLNQYASKDKVEWLLENYELSQSFEFKGMVIDYYTLKA